MCLHSTRELIARDPGVNYKERRMGEMDGIHQEPSWDDCLEFVITGGGLDMSVHSLVQIERTDVHTQVHTHTGTHTHTHRYIGIQASACIQHKYSYQSILFLYNS